MWLYRRQVVIGDADRRRQGEDMKLLTAVVTPNQVQRITAALDGAGLAATTVASAQASGLASGPSLQYKGVEYRDQRCVRLEVLVSDVDLEYAVALVAPTGAGATEGVTVWAVDVDDLSAMTPPARVPELANQT